VYWAKKECILVLGFRSAAAAASMRNHAPARFRGSEWGFYVCIFVSLRANESGRGGGIKLILGELHHWIREDFASLETKWKDGCADVVFALLVLKSVSIAFHVPVSFFCGVPILGGGSLGFQVFDLMPRSMDFRSTIQVNLSYQGMDFRAL
jgi:hypothetical protein